MLFSLNIARNEHFFRFTVKQLLQKHVKNVWF